MTSGRIKSGKVKKIAPTAVTADRYNFIQLSETEPDLGVPAATGYVLTSDTTGTRSWVAAASTLETSPITFVGDDSTGTGVNLGETFKIAGTQNVTTAVSGDTLTITGPNLTNYVQRTDKAITVVGDDSTGTDLNIGETIKIAGTGGITTAVSGDTLTISVSKNLDVNEISSSDSTAIQVNDGLNVRGTLTATGLVANGLTYPTIDGTSNQVLVTNGSGILSFTNLTSFAGITFVGDDSTGSTINTAETLKFVGGNNITTAVVDDVVTITGSKNINVNEISSTDSTAIQVNDGLNVSGPLTTSNFSSPSATITGGTIDNVAIGGTTAAAGTFTTLTATTSLTANTIVTNEISSTDSTAIQVNDGVNVIGNVTAYTFNTEGLSVYRNNILSTRSDDNLVLSASGSGRIYVQGNFEVSNTAYLNNVTVTGTATLPVIKTNLISSDDSTAVQVADGMNVSGTLSADVLDVNEISSADSSAIQINDAVNISGTLNAKTIVTNDLISEDSTAINVLDGMNVSGTLSADVLGAVFIGVSSPRYVGL